MVKKILALDPEKCNGCRQCEIACSINHTGVSNPARSRIRIIKRENDNVFIPVKCQHCEDAPCMNSCPDNAIFQDEKLGRVMINYGLCASCKMCVSVCPFGAVEFDHIKKKIIKCDLCGGEPQCVPYCETGAIQFIEDYSFQIPNMRKYAAKIRSLHL